MSLFSEVASCEAVFVNTVSLCLFESMLAFLQFAVEKNADCQEANQYQCQKILQVQMVYSDLIVSSIPQRHCLAAHHVQSLFLDYSRSHFEGYQSNLRHEIWHKYLIPAIRMLKCIAASP